MGFAEFVGNAKGVAVLTRMLARERVPATLLLSGQKGVGKFTLATMFARALLCEREKRDFCSGCESCRVLAALDDLPNLLAQARAARGRADPEEVPLVLQPHPDVSVLVPDPTYIRMSQMRAARRLAYSAPRRRRRVIIIDDAERLRVDFASTLLKVLEEPPAHTHFVLIAHAPLELPATIRSRTVPLHFAPLTQQAIEAYLAQQRPKLAKKDRALVASAAAGSLGTALRFDLEHYRAVRRAALCYLRASIRPDGPYGRGVGPATREESYPTELFAATAELAGRARRESAEGAGGERAEFEFSLDLLYSLLSDVLYLKAEASDLGLHNPDVRSELERFSHQIDWPWVAGKVSGLDRIKRRLRRNLNRQLALDALAQGGLASKLGESGEPAGAS
ncbi:MAG: AAA family ATPase [Terriglobia bacterium]